MHSKFIGMTVYPEYVQFEGLHKVLENIQSKAKINAICTISRITKFVDSRKEGIRVPPLDIEGYERVLDRPLWGEKELFGKFFWSYRPNYSLYENTVYTPPPPYLKNEESRENIVREIIEESRKRGMRTYLQIIPLAPYPKSRKEDAPVRIDNTVPTIRIGQTGCVNNPNIRNYALALVEDVITHYPEIDGLFLDWVEYTNYFLEDNFVCFCPWCVKEAGKLGYDWGLIESSVKKLYKRLHFLTCKDLERIIEHSKAGVCSVMELFLSYPGVLELIRFKRESIVNFIKEVNKLIEKKAVNHIELGMNGAAPALSVSSGIDYNALSMYCNVLRPKQYNFHWSMMIKWYTETLIKWNPHLPERLCIDAMSTLLGFNGKDLPRTLSSFGMSSPETTPPIPLEALATQMNKARDLVKNETTVLPLIHCYGPINDLKKKLMMVIDSEVGGCWLQQYAHTSDEKLAVIGQMWNRLS